MVLKRRDADRSTPIRQSGRRTGEARQDSLHFHTVTTSRYFDEGNGNSAFPEPERWIY
jgi:hypothetical protein